MQSQNPFVYDILSWRLHRLYGETENRLVKNG
jgi:hypothetical protein